MGWLNSPDEIIASVDLDRARTETNADSNIQQVMDEMVADTNLSPMQKQQLLSLLSEFSDIFAPDPKKPSQTDLVNHKITVNTSNPIYMKPRRIPLAWEKEVDDQVKEMFRNNIIQESSSPWNAPILLVKKKDQTVRFVCDFRALNEIRRKTRTPYPRLRA